MKRFGGFHPLVLAAYYLSAVMPAMFVTDIYTAALSWLVGMLWLALVKRRFPLGQLIFSAAAVLAMAAVNALVSHNGATELIFINKRAVTLEALRYGALSGLMLSAVLVWFASFSDIMTSEKIIALMGRLPKLGLTVSMVLHLVSEYAARFKRVKRAYDINSAGEASKTPADYMRLMSAVFTWALESSMQTADSMEMRGYSSGKKRYSPYRFKASDGLMLALIIALQAMYFMPLPLRTAFTALDCALPIIYEGKERLKWGIFSLKK
ncbi:MAG: energy-coupling factor transporter transmembrane protein EcfT [Butyrivibrio sp.]|nr:energy-coupling factor transporter transmembrane protein EcfT [Butyrivibrio sp.]